MRWDRPPLHQLQVTLPSWIAGHVDYAHEYATDAERMHLAVRLSRANIEHGTGGPFGAAVFERGTGRLVSVGVNGVTRLNNSTAHAEMLALQLAERRVVSYTLAADGHPAHELFTSCAPCAMCLGAILWSGVTRVVCGALREDAEQVHFDEGPVFAESYAYLRARGVEIVTGVEREAARAVLQDYVAGGGIVYNG